MRATIEHVTDWAKRYRRLRDIAERVERMRIDRARKLCVEAGLDGNLLGIHPHNAWISRQAGQPWPGVDDSKLRACLRVLNLPSAHRVVTAWDHRVRFGGEQEGER